MGRLGNDTAASPEDRCQVPPGQWSPGRHVVPVREEGASSPSSAALEQPTAGSGHRRLVVMRR